MRAHFQAIKTRLETGTSLPVYDTGLVNPDGSPLRGNYFIVFGGAPARQGAARYAFRQVPGDNAQFDYTVRAVAIDPATVRGMLELADELLTGWVPTVEGRRCAPLQYPEQTVVVRADTDVKPPLFFADAEWVLSSFFIGGS